MKSEIRIALTGFMGVGKSSVARHLEHLTGCPRYDLDSLIEDHTGRQIAAIIDTDGMDAFRKIENEVLADVLQREQGCILSLGGGTWTIPKNRELIKQNRYTSVWLESTFDHCWYNIKFSRKDRPLARDKDRARKLFDERQQSYCLADWHFIIRSGLGSFEIAQQIAEQVL
jgi:shikimate kinase